MLTTAVGYAQGHVQQPTYKQVCSGITGHTEAVRLTFDPEVLSYGELVEKFWSRRGFDMTQKNGQGNDWGTQYRSGFYTNDDEQGENRGGEQGRCARRAASRWRNRSSPPRVLAGRRAPPRSPGRRSRREQGARRRGPVPAWVSEGPGAVGSVSSVAASS